MSENVLQTGKVGLQRYHYITNFALILAVIFALLFYSHTNQHYNH